MTTAGVVASNVSEAAGKCTDEACSAVLGVGVVGTVRSDTSAVSGAKFEYTYAHDCTGAAHEGCAEETDEVKCCHVCKIYVCMSDESAEGVDAPSGALVGNASKFVTAKVTVECLATSVSVNLAFETDLAEVWSVWFDVATVIGCSDPLN